MIMIALDYLVRLPMVWFGVAFGTVLVAVTLRVLLVKRWAKYDAAVVPGLPLLGNALPLGRHGVSYINKCRRKFGDSFSLSLAGVKMTFLFEPSHIDYFFSAPDEKITFRPAVEQFTQRVFGLTSRLFFPLHFKMLTELRHLLVPGALQEHMQAMGRRALQLLPCYVHHSQVDLYSLCRSLVFHCAVEAVFGRPFVEGLPELMRLGPAAGEERRISEMAGAADEAGHVEQQLAKPMAGEATAATAATTVWANASGTAAEARRCMLPRPPVGVERLAREFFTFEDCFELAASPLPHAFQSDFVQSRSELLRVLRAADRLGLLQGTPAGQLLDRTTGLPTRLRPNLLLALMWASQANTIPAVFWSTAFLLLPENANHKADVMAELERELQTMRLSPGAPEQEEEPPDASGVTSRMAAGSPGTSGSSPRPPSSSQVVAAATRLAASRRSSVSRCVAEALRLRVQSIDVRQVASPLDLPSESRPGRRLRLPRGRLLAVCPFESHHDRKLCGADGGAAADPWVFDPTRPEVRLGDGSAVLPSVAGLAFGGGPYRCPGRFFAEQELGLLVQLFLWSYDMTLSYGDTTGSKARPQAKEKASAPAVVESPELQQAPMATAATSSANPHPQLRAVQGGSFLYNIITLLFGPAAMAWGFGWFDGLDGPLQDWRESGDPAGLLPPCELRRLVGVKVPKKPCWVQLGRVSGGSITLGKLAKTSTRG